MKVNRRGFIKGAGVFAAAACGGAADGEALDVSRPAGAPRKAVDVLVVAAGPSLGLDNPESRTAVRFDNMP